MLLGRSINFATFLMAELMLNFDGAISIASKILLEIVGDIDLTTLMNLLMISNVKGHSVILFLLIE